MPVRSPYPDVEIPDVSLTAFLFGDFGDRADAPAFVDGASGRSITFGELADDGRQDRRRAGRARHRGGRRRRALRPELAGVGRGLPRRAARQRRRDQRELALHPGRAGPPARRLRREAARHGLAVPRPRAGGARRGRAARGRASVTLDAVDRASRRSPTCSPPRPRRPELTTTAGDTAVLPYSSGTTGRAKGVILTHRNLVANLCQFAPMGHVGVRDDDPRRAAVLPHLRDDRDDEPGPAQARHRRHDAEVRPHRVPPDHRRVRAWTGSTSPRRSPSRWPSTRSSTSTTSPAST